MISARDYLALAEAVAALAHDNESGTLVVTRPGHSRATGFSMLVVTNKNPERLAEVAALHAKWYPNQRRGL